MSNNFFPATSRYAPLDTKTLETADGGVIRYLERRFLPSPDRFQLLETYAVRQNDRLDNITARFLGDPEQFWRLCDANNAMRPEELETMGRVLRITLPEGIPGTPNA